MQDRRVSRLGVVVAIGAGATLVGTQLALYATGTPTRDGAPADLAGVVETVLVLAPFALVGGALTARLPRHPVGWLLLAMGVAGATLSAGTLVHGLAQDPGLRSVGAWVDAGLWHPTFPALGLLFLLFPTGRPPSPRWRWVQVGLVAAWVFLLVTGPFTTSGLLLEFYPDADPVLGGPWSPALRTVHDTVQFLVVFPLLLVAVASMVRRAVAAVGVERQQLRWFATSVVTIAVAFALSLTLRGDGSFGAPFFALLPISCAVAVLRHRLYDLDRLISRTVTYAAVLAVLASVYVAAVFLLRGLLPLDGDLAVAASTLAVAALFDPLRRRVQAAVERRFNRPRYDADRQLEVLSARLRDSLDLGELTGHVTGLVHGSLQPTTVSLWSLPVGTGSGHRQVQPDLAATARPGDPLGPSTDVLEATSHRP